MKQLKYSYESEWIIDEKKDDLTNLSIYKEYFSSSLDTYILGWSKKIFFEFYFA
jgi:hypothetical protein